MLTRSLTFAAIFLGAPGLFADEEVVSEAEAEADAALKAEAEAAAPPPGAPRPAPPVEPTAPPTTATASAAFIKGDLIQIGTTTLISPYDHVGVQIGPHILRRDFFLGVTPVAAFYPGEWSFGVQVPLNLLMFQGGTTEFGGGKIRRQDWDEVSDFARVIRFVGYGRREDPLFFSINSLRPSTLGHGSVMINYQPNVDVDRSMTGVMFDAYNDYAGFQLKANDVTFQNRVLGGLVFVKPLGWLDHPVPKSLSLGVEYAADLRAPRCVRLSIDDAACVQGSGHRAGPDPLTGAIRDDTFVRTDPDVGRPVVEETAVHAIGFSGEMRLFKTEQADTKVYATFHHFLEHGEGLALGLIGRFTLGEATLSAFRVRAEYRNFSSAFLPGYFDTLYEVSKYQFIQASTPFQVSPTKFQAVFGDPDNGFVLTETERHHGYRGEFSYGLFAGERKNKILAFGFGLEGSTRDSTTSFYAHLELPGWKWFQLFGTFLRLNAEGIEGVFASDLDNVVVLSGARLQVLPVLFINAHYSRAFQIIRSPGREFRLGNANVVDEAGRTSALYASDRIYENIDTLHVTLELGYEFL